MIMFKQFLIEAAGAKHFELDEHFHITTIRDGSKVIHVLHTKNSTLRMNEYPNSLHMYDLQMKDKNKDSIIGHAKKFANELGKTLTNRKSVFKEFLIELFAQEKIHINPSMGAIKNLARNSKYGNLRFVYHENKDMHVGDAEHFYHGDLIHHTSSLKFDGYIYHNRDINKFTYAAFSHYHEYKGPELERFHKAGITKEPQPFDPLRGSNRVYLKEELTSRIHRNIGIDALLNLNKQHGITRFVIHNDKIHAADANYFYHGDICDATGSRNRLVDGAIRYNKETNTHEFYGADPKKNFKPSNHPLLQKFESKGAIRSTRHQILD